jgi:hypothetical protein
MEVAQRKPFHSETSAALLERRANTLSCESAGAKSGVGLGRHKVMGQSAAATDHVPDALSIRPSPYSFEFSMKRMGPPNARSTVAQIARYRRRIRRRTASPRVRWYQRRSGNLVVQLAISDQ